MDLTQYCSAVNEVGVASERDGRGRSGWAFGPRRLMAVEANRDGPRAVAQLEALVGIAWEICCRMGVRHFQDKNRFVVFYNSAPDALNTDSIFNPSSPGIARLSTCGRTSLRKASNNRAPAQVVCLRLKHGASRPHSRYSWTCRPIQQCSRLLRIRPTRTGVWQRLSDEPA